MLTATTRYTDFPSLTDRTYLNTAAEGIPPQAVTDALLEYAQDKQLGMDGRLRHEARWQSAKEQVARQYGLTADEIGICSCSSEAYNLAAAALQPGAGDEIIINDLDFPAGATPWLQSTCAADVRLWESREGALRVEDLLPLLGPKTRLLTVSLVSFFNGYKIPLAEVLRAVRKDSPALVAVDVTQALGRIPLDLADVDLVVSSTHKWILATHGGGLVGVPASRAETWTVPAGGWFNLQNAFATDRFQRAVSKPGAASFTVGMPNYPAVYAIDAALRYIDTVGVPAIDAHARPLVRQCIDGLKKLSVDLITPDEPDTLAGIVAFRHPDAARIVASLHAKNIHIMGHAGRLRVAIHGYNTMGDVEVLLRSLDEVL
ncbi:MAG: aminotransferase class V-fold PLP-dependent enzyme [Pirellulales bacterium]